MTDRQGPDAGFWIRGARVLEVDLEGARVAERAVHVRGGRIAAVVPEADARPRGAPVVDGSDRLLTPGLVNAHAHGAMTLFRGAVEDVDAGTWFNEHVWRMETNLEAEDVYWGVRLAAAEMLAAGVTAVADHYFHADAVARGYGDGGMRALVAPTLFGRDPDAELAAAEAVVDRWHGADAGRIRIWIGPHSPYLNDDALLVAARDLAARRGLGLHLHVSETADQVAASLERTGRTPPQHLDALGVFDVPTLVAHAAHARDDDLPILARAAAVVHCPKTFLKMALGLPRIDRMLAGGVTVALGSDGAASNATLDVLEQLRLTGLAQKHMAADARTMPVDRLPPLATAAGGAALGVPGLGTLHAGAPADLALWRLDRPGLVPVHDALATFAYALSARDVDRVWVAGIPRVLGGELVDDPGDVLREVRLRAPRLVERGAGKMQDFPG